MPFTEITVRAGEMLARTEHRAEDGTPYNYIPTRYVAIIFIALYGFSTALHGIQSIKYRMWWILPTAFSAGLIEVIGWSGRLWSSYSPGLDMPFQIQICCTIIAPTPLVAANFLILSRIILRLGSGYSRLNPQMYAIIFCSFDLISLVVQAVGGGMAAVAAGNNRDPTPGGHIMLGGISFQLFTILVYVICAGEFFIRYFKDWPLHLQFMIYALIFNTTCLFIRAVYRVVELSGGWNGRVISTQRYFNICDGAMVVLAIYTLNFAHPGWLLGNASPKRVNIEGSQDSNDDQ